MDEALSCLFESPFPDSAEIPFSGFLETAVSPMSSPPSNGFLLPDGKWNRAFEVTVVLPHGGVAQIHVDFVSLQSECDLRIAAKAAPLLQYEHLYRRCKQTHRTDTHCTCWVYSFLQYLGSSRCETYHLLNVAYQASRALPVWAGQVTFDATNPLHLPLPTARECPPRPPSVRPPSPTPTEIVAAGWISVSDRTDTPLVLAVPDGPVLETVVPSEADQ